MYAIVEIAGQQFKVEEGQKLFVHQLEANEGDAVTFDRVLLVDNDGDVTVGKPTVEGVSVSATVLGHQKGDKVIVFKKKRRKGYRVKNGHRQRFTSIKIDVIGEGVASRTVMAAAAPVVEADDLTKIEGIGPKISELLKNAGINTFADLAAANQEQLKQILADGGTRFASKNPSTWAKQAELAAAGEWEKLQAWQDELDGGVEK